MEFQNENNNAEVIHCKVSYNDQLRRFALTSTEFTSLRATIAQLFSINPEFVLKYKDDESDYVTVENDQDLITAIMISPKLLRLRVELPNNHAPDMNLNEASPCMKQGRKRWGHQGHHGPHGFGPGSHGFGPGPHGFAPGPHGFGPGPHGFAPGPHGFGPGPHGFAPGSGFFFGHPGPSFAHNDGFGGHHGGRHGGRQGGHCKWRNDPEARKQWIEKKLAWINATLQDLQDDSTLAPSEQWKKQRLIKKKERLEYFLQSGDFVGGCRREKKRTLTSEEEQINCAIKLQILEIKGEMEKLKLRKKEIKSLLQNNRDDAVLKSQLADVKDQERLFKQQKREVRDKMHS